MINIALIFSEADNKKLAQISQNLHAKAPSEYRLGVNSTPHFTLLNINTPAENAPELWEKLCAAGLNVEYSVVLKGFYVSGIQPKEPKRFYTGFALEELGKWCKIQDNIMRITKGLEITSAVGTEFFPHITTSCHLNPFAREKMPPQKPPFKRITAHLAIGTRDDFGTMKEVLFTSQNV